jgi:hydrogenase-1 operon protein HyaF
MAAVTRLTDIPIGVEDAGEPTGMADAILREISQMLTRLADTGEPGTIDLRAMPLAPADFAVLRERLGRGEVQATIDVSGPTEVTETAFAGVWWIAHKNIDGHAVTEQIEVTRVPAILAAHPEDIRRAKDRLAASLGPGPAED